tara:strand:- start:1570 stop:2151 length:582 start_codon:yes stop_codon:yes gene_type:complete
MISIPTGSIIIFDTEYTTWEGAQERKWSGENEYRELVQIAAQKVDMDNEEVLGQYSELVVPRINSQLSDFFTELTHITQAQLDEGGRDFAEVYPEFIEWCADAHIYSYGSSKKSDGTILEENIELYQLDLPYNDEVYHNLRPLFQEAGIDVTQYTSGELFRAFDLDIGGHVHNAMHDVNSLTQSLFALKQRLK